MDGMPAEGTSLPSVGAEIAGKYRIESVLGQGGMGAVFAARNKLTGKRVAIKWLLPEHAGSTTRERLLREAQIASSIEHPNVVDIYDVGEHEGGLFLVMEYLRGKPLSDVLAEVGRMDPEQLIALIVPAMRGVHAAHLAGVIHRDLKPDNIILSEQDGKIVPKVVDFGVSKLVGATELPSSLTRTGALVGTPHYMALEQVDGSNDIDSRTDVYAFGVLLYRALTGHFPHDGSTLGEVILKIGTKDAQPMRTLRPDLPSALDPLILRALSRDRGRRFKDLEELARVLAPFTHMRPGEPIEISMLPRAVRSVPPISQHSQAGAIARPTPPIGQRRRRTRALLSGAAVALALLAGVAFMSMRQPEAAPLVERASASEVPAAAQPSEQPVAAPTAPAPVEPALELPVDDTLAQPKPSEQVNVALAEKPAVSSARDKPRERKSNKPVRAPKSATPSVIPGERTNGLAADDF
ncbi:MAG TPA: serine/threonine-protein kinase [Polyangiales bacterium]|nr:serine/threonine-protein kinase [Polyangiales bacterium]